MALKIQTDPHIALNFSKFSAVAGFFTSLVGLIVLIGWVTGIRVLMSISDAWSPMKPYTALCFVLLGLAFLLLLSNRKGLPIYLAHLLAFIVALTGFITLCEYTFGWNTGIHTLVFPGLLNVAHQKELGRMAPNTALCFVLLGAALFLINGQLRKLRLLQLISVLSGLISLTALVGYLYSIPVLRGLPAYTQMAAHTAVIILLFSIALICARPEGLSVGTAASEGPGGTVMRRLLPALIIVTILIGWLVLMGERIGAYGSSYALALFAVLMVVVLTVLITRSSIALQSSHTSLRAIQKEWERQALELAEKNQMLQGQFDSAPAGLALFDAEPPYKVLAHNTIYQHFWNEPFRSEGMIGKYLSDYVSDAEDNAVFEIFRDVTASKEARTVYEFPYDGMDRGRTWWNWSLSPVVRDDRVVALAHMLIEVTDQVVARTRIEEMLALEQEQTEELKCQGEELAAANEELISTNEELLVTNERLVQANEALHLVNEVAADFLGHASLEHSLETLLSTAKKLVKAESVSIAVYEYPDTLKTWIFDTEGAECKIDLQQQAVKAFPHLAEKYSQGIVINNNPSDLYLPNGHITISSLLALGFEVSGGWAHLFMANKPGGFDDVDAERAEILTHITKIIIDRAVLDDREHDARSEAERRAGELQAFISSIADGITLFDAEGNVVLMNDVGREILGVPPDASFDTWKQNYKASTLDGEPIPVEQTASWRALQGEIISDMRSHVVSPSGKSVILSVSASPVKDQQGRIIGATNVFRDITEQVKLEKSQEELYIREHNIARTLQQAVIPEPFYNIPGCKVVVKYEPALKEAEVGGDFYDIFEVGENKIGILIGDVAGKGLPAAMRVAAARYAVRSYAFLDPDPAAVLTLANDALSRDGLENGKMLTVFFGVVDLANHTLTSACGGHEPPLILDNEGNVEEVDATGIALGITRSYTYSASTRPFNPGEVMVLFTDGITEARTSGSNLFGVERVIKHVRSCAGVSLDELASTLMSKAKAHAGGAFRDDAAVLVFSVDQPYDAPVENLVIHLSDEAELNEYRNMTEDIALRAGFDREDIWDIMTSVFEACVNALVHGNGNVSGGATLQLQRYPDRIQAVVRDDGEGFDAPSDSPIPPASSPRGRGIPLMRLLMDEVKIDNDNGCKVTMTKWLPGKNLKTHNQADGTHRQATTP